MSSSKSNDTLQEPKNHSTNKEVTNETAHKTSSRTTTNTMPDGNETEETAKSKARFRKYNLFIDTEEANAFFNKKK
ncbi:hypothetical protein KCU91_g1022, partial [Aureobasidium melanogenum]